MINYVYVIIYVIIYYVSVSVYENVMNIYYDHVINFNVNVNDHVIYFNLHFHLIDDHDVINFIARYYGYVHFINVYVIYVNVHVNVNVNVYMYVSFYL